MNLKSSLAFCLALGVAASATAGDLSVRGFGPWRNLEMERNLRLLLGREEAMRSGFDAAFIEDAALVLGSELVEEGFFRAEIDAFWISADGTESAAVLDTELSRPLPRPLLATDLRLVARPGLRAVVESVTFEGLTVWSAKEVETIFRPDTGLFTPDRARAWSEERARRSAGQLREVLRARGYQEARVEVVAEGPEAETGAVHLRVLVEEGPVWRVRSWRADRLDDAPWLGGELAELGGAVWTRSLARDIEQKTRRAYHRAGYAEVRVAWTAEPGGTEDGVRAVDLIAQVEAGRAWRNGEIRFEDEGVTERSLLRERAGLETGEPWDPSEVDAARLRLARLGVYRRVEAGPAAGGDEEGERAVVFSMREEAPWKGAWSAGYGSYEQLRGAVELSRTNLWGLAHRDQIELGQSFKASRGEYRYVVPTLFSGTVEGAGRIFGLRREEPAFVRLEYGAGLEVARELSRWDARGAAGLSYEVLRADEVDQGVVDVGLTETTVTALNLGLTRDRRDNPLRPRAGGRWSVRTETALPELGGEARYQRVEADWSWHRPWGTERWWHLGISQGLIAGADGEVPVNRLFFPGGESSIRGYGEGEAAPRDGSGRLTGARSTWLVNLEFEQLITGRWTGVIFNDLAGVAARLEDWPGDEVLSSLGLGIRYQSPIGPLRLEQAWNLRRRERDPAGTLHFSIGFPF